MKCGKYNIFSSADFELLNDCISILGYQLVLRVSWYVIFTRFFVVDSPHGIIPRASYLISARLPYL